MGLQLPGFGISVGILALLVIFLIVALGHCTFAIGISGGHVELGLH